MQNTGGNLGIRGYCPSLQKLGISLEPNSSWTFSPVNSYIIGKNGALLE